MKICKESYSYKNIQKVLVIVMYKMRSIIMVLILLVSCILAKEMGLKFALSHINIGRTQENDNINNAVHRRVKREAEPVMVKREDGEGFWSQVWEDKGDDKEVEPEVEGKRNFGNFQTSEPCHGNNFDDVIRCD